ncbi:hypothetical protein G9U52_11215 [Paenibacillus sp. S3N08]|uniref:Uncharacterized protein n=1 Tax=Paenibacillus agricola TaxID=2716264 RepID=A0ABX0J6E3_9BACL|nr:hypothetical protein [Paenibacillus agricola]
MDFIAAFLQERWYIIVAAIIILFIVVRIVKTVIKWVIVLAIVAGLYFYGASYKDQLINMGASVGASVTTEVKNQAAKIVSSEMKDAQYKQNPDGSYTVTTKSLRVDGKPGASEVNVTFMNQTFTMKLDDIIKALIDQAKANTAA